MLINKFRIKYGVKADIDDFDLVIKAEVEALMVQEKISEGELMKLDKKLALRLTRNPEEGLPIGNIKQGPPSQKSNASFRSRMYRSLSQKDDISIKSQKQPSNQNGDDF